MKLTREWQEYDHDYTKDIHDIRTKDGKEYHQCWPNAGYFNVMSTNVDIPDAEVTHVRCNKDWMTKNEQEQKETDGKGYPDIAIIGHESPGRTVLVSNASGLVIDKELAGNEISMAAIEDRILITDPHKSVAGGYSRNKIKKPNKGLQIGSYKYRGR